MLCCTKTQPGAKLGRLGAMRASNWEMLGCRSCCSSIPAGKGRRWGGSADCTGSSVGRMTHWKMTPEMFELLRAAPGLGARRETQCWEQGEGERGKTLWGAWFGLTMRNSPSHQCHEGCCVSAQLGETRPSGLLLGAQEGDMRWDGMFGRRIWEGAGGDTTRLQDAGKWKDTLCFFNFLASKLPQQELGAAARNPSSPPGICLDFGAGGWMLFREENHRRES